MVTANVDTSLHVNLGGGVFHEKRRRQCVQVQITWGAGDLS